MTGGVTGGVPGGVTADGAIETEVPGEPAAVRELARWLRGTLAADVADAADRQVHARRRAAVGWEGAGASAYYDAAGAAVLAVDDHAERVRRAAVVVEDVADHLVALRRTMADVRDRATVGGLTVAGTRVLRPVEVAVGPVPPGLGLQPGAAERALYDVLAREVAQARAEHADWVGRRLPRAVADAEERDDVDRVLAGLEGAGAGGPGRAAGARSGPSTGLAGRGGGAGVGAGGGTLAAGPAPGSRPGPTDTGPTDTGPTDPGPGAGTAGVAAGAAARTGAPTVVPTVVPRMVAVAVDGSGRDAPPPGEVRSVEVPTPWEDPDPDPARDPGAGDHVVRADLGPGAPRAESGG